MQCNGLKFRPKKKSFGTCDKISEICAFQLSFPQKNWWKIAKKTIGWSDFNAHFMGFSFFLFADFVKNNAAAVSRKNSTTSRKSSSVNNKPNTTIAASSKHLCLILLIKSTEILRGAIYGPSFKKLLLFAHFSLILAKVGRRWCI